LEILTLIEVSNNKIYIAINRSGNISDYLPIVEATILEGLSFSGEIIFDTLLNCISKDDHRRYKTFRVKDSSIELSSMSYLFHIDDDLFNDFEIHFKKVDRKIVESSMLNQNDAAYYIKKHII
jgi:pyruvate/2-oxoacid:ferredoxin oxidoreductase beta subunit